MQGDLFLEDGKLCFLGGGVYETAQFDLDDGKCLNVAKDDPRSQFRTAFYPYYPEYGNYLSLDHNLAGGRSLIFDASYEGNRFTPLALLSPLPEGVQKIRKDAARWSNRRGWSEKRKVLWQEKQGRRIASFVVSSELLIVAGDLGENPKKTFLAALQIEDGKVVWSEALPSQPIKGGVSIDHRGSIFVTLANGQTFCYGTP
tara:strand:- start:291 stop:893 length:603 start_codon:yes stop_codon:yes gene_type:complete